MKNTIPADFPRLSAAGAVAGFQPKVLLEKKGDEYHLHTSEETVARRFDLCSDLVDHLVAYCKRKSTEHPEWSREFNVARAERGLREKVRSRRWDFSEHELRWMIKRVLASV